MKLYLPAPPPDADRALYSRLALALPFFGAHLGGALLRVETAEDADALALPMRWIWYTRSASVSVAAEVSRQAARRGQPLIVWHEGDEAPRVPFANAVVFQPAAYRSRGCAGHVIAPPAIADPLAQQYVLPPGGARNGKPRIGFCGAAVPAPMSRRIATRVRRIASNLRDATVGGAYQPPPAFLNSRALRAKLLKALREDGRVETDFTIRAHYHGESGETPERVAAAREFVGNILRTDYTLCVRGAGNWSKRFYETLACGRIPVMLDTDCVLPLEDRVDWGRYCIVVPQRRWRRTADYVVDFQRAHAGEKLAQVQDACRELWVSMLSTEGYLRQLPSLLPVSRQQGG